MINPKSINELVDKLMGKLPKGIKNAPEEIKNNLRSVLKAGFEKMDLVTREEFDAQVAVLARTREKLEALEKELTELKK